MKSISFFLTITLFGLGVSSTANARDINVPAGTLMTCTLDEPNFSSATISVEDPFLCYPRNMQQFGQNVFPRGAYLVGHLENAKEPGHFVGKGYLKLTIDRIGLPTTDIPINAKVISVSHFKVDREGKIIGHGHATRDTIEWMLPPLWPWKVLTLPARGPRPTLKGETRITLRVMDDFIVPQNNSSGWHHFGEEPSSYVRPRPESAPPVASAYRPVVAAQPKAVEIATPQPSAIAPADWEKPFTSHDMGGASPGKVTLFALTDGTLFSATNYWRDRDQLVYTSGEDQGTVSFKNIDWSTTMKLNEARNVRVTLRSAPPAQ